MSSIRCRDWCQKYSKKRPYKKEKYRQIRPQLVTYKPDKKDLDYRYSLQNPLNILILFLLYKQRDSKVLNDPVLLEICETFEQDKQIDIQQAKVNDKGFIRMVWMWQMKNHSLFCDLCGNEIELPKDITLDHKIPKCRGGKVTVENSRPAHKKCNNLKGCLTPEQWVEQGKEILERYNINIQRLSCGYNYKER